MKVNEATEHIIAAAIEVHRALGPGLLESAYEACLVYELTQRGLYFQRQAALPVVYSSLQRRPHRLRLSPRLACRPPNCRRTQSD